MSIFTTKFSDADLITGLIAGGSLKRNFENKLYNKYNYFIKEATFKHKIESEEASMAYSDAILTSLEHINNGRFEGRSELKTYIYQIFFNKCVDFLRRRATKEKYITSIDNVLEPLPDNQRSAILQLIQNQDYEQLKARMSLLGDRCQHLLRRWSEGFTDKESADEYGYNSANVSQTTRLRCLEKLRELYMTKSEPSTKLKNERNGIEIN